MKTTWPLYENFSVKVPVRYRKPGNVVAHVLITFALRCGAAYCSAKPLCNAATRRLLNLPDRFTFDRINGRALVQPATLAPVVRQLMKSVSGKPVTAFKRPDRDQRERLELL